MKLHALPGVAPSSLEGTGGPLVLKIHWRGTPHCFRPAAHAPGGSSWPRRISARRTAPGPKSRYSGLILYQILAARPGRSSEITTARHNKIVDRLREAGLGVIADLSFVGLDTNPDDPVVITGYKAAHSKPLTSAKKQVNKLIAAERAACEHAFAHLKNWRILTNSGPPPATRPRCCEHCSS
ncbi:transposase family protein [Streptomyces pseudovenezuelae]|uniref:transposase family protein n=1 Tax=Streptomyces pseudovenezuelae TaxID=67350 RepID=UPI0036E9D90C